MRTIIICNIFLFFLSTFFFSGPVHARRYHRIDLNKDGKVTRREKEQYSLWKKHEARIKKKWIAKRREWRSYRYRVGSHYESNFDANKDGWLSPGETKELLYAKYRIVLEQGSAMTESRFEKPYDTNSNGSIDKKEAKAIAQDL